MNRINKKLQEDKKLLSIYYTAGYPEIEDTLPTLQALQENGVDMVEIGLPFSDPLADGPTIQKSSTAALKNGMTTTRLFEQLQEVRKSIDIPLIIMGYFNPILQFGVADFCSKCKQIGIDGIILPDLPLEEYELHYKEIFEKNDLKFIFLITPQTSEERIRQIDAASDAFIYMVSTASTTGSTSGFSDVQQDYFKRVASMDLKNPQIVGFGIKDRDSFKTATTHAKGAIIGSAFIKHVTSEGVQKIDSFVNNIR